MLRSVILYIVLYLPFYFNVTGQVDTKYNLLTEPYVDRPLALHKGQFQFGCGYQFSIINKKYDQNGDKIDLTIDGSVSAQHKVPFKVKYGLFEFLQFSASTAYASMGIRSQNHNIISSESELYVSELNKYTGMYNLYIGTDLTAPIKLHIINWVISAGIYLPVFDYQPDKPDHSYTILDSESGSVQLDYRYNYKNSTGVPEALVGSSLKLRTEKISITGTFDYTTALKDGECYDWNFRLVGSEFEYEKETYLFNTGQTINCSVEAAWQAIEWFTLRGALSYFQHSKGWRNVTGKKVGESNMSLSNLFVGYEILVSPLLRIEQQIILPVSGKNITGQWTFLTGFNLNLFTSGKNHKNSE